MCLVDVGTDVGCVDGGGVWEGGRVGYEVGEGLVVACGAYYEVTACYDLVESAGNVLV